MGHFSVYATLLLVLSSLRMGSKRYPETSYHSKRATTYATLTGTRVNENLLTSLCGTQMMLVCLEYNCFSRLIAAETKFRRNYVGVTNNAVNTVVSLYLVEQNLNNGQSDVRGKCNEVLRYAVDLKPGVIVTGLKVRGKKVLARHIVIKSY